MLTGYATILSVSMSVSGGMQSQSELTDSQEIQNWILEQWVHGSPASGHQYIFAEWVDRYHEVPDADTLEKLRQSVRGRPQHPQYAELAQYERRLREGPDIEEIKYWLGEPGAFRRSATNSSGYSDIVVTPKRSWSVSPHQLTAFNPANGFPEGYNYGPWEGVGRRVVGGFLHGAFSIKIPIGNVSITDFDLVNDTWRCAIFSQDPLIKLVAEGMWDTRTKSGYAESVRITEFDQSPDEVGRRWEFAGWGEFTHGEDVLFAVQREYASNGRLVQETELRSVQTISREEFRRVIEQPSLNRREDPIRGQLSFLAVHRFGESGEPPVVDMLDPQTGEITTVSERNFTKNKNRRILQATGLIFAVGIILVVLGINQKIRS